MANCLLCLQCDLDSEKCIQVNSKEWKDNDIKKLIDKHLWPLNTIKENSWICQPCWEELKDFHKFYSRIEEAHNDFKSLVKSETDPLEDESKPTDLELKILLESEIVIGEAMGADIVIKEEDEEPSLIRTMDVVQEKTSTEDMISNRVIRDDPDFINHVSEGSCNDGNESDSDDDMPLTERVTCSKKTSTNTKSTNNDRKNNVDEDEYNSNSDLDPLQSTYESNRKKIKTISSTAEKSAIKTKSYYTPKTNRLEQDKFLQEHYKIACSKCDLTFDTFPLLCNHFSNEHNERGFVTCCETKFFRRSLLVDHINFHLNPEYFKCKICGKILPQRRYLANHMKLHEDKKFECDVCSKKFTEKTKLERHKLTHLSPAEKKFACGECGKFYANESILSIHKRAVHLSVYAKICEICGQTVPDSSSLKLHMQQKHELNPDLASTPESYCVTCEECGRVLTGPIQLKLHREQQHPAGGKREYSCHICPKVSPTLRALKKHIRFAHEMSYDFKCTICGKAFKRADNLKTHIATHTGTPLYQCPNCSKTFNCSGNMYTHRKRVHPIEWEESVRRKYSGNWPPHLKPPADTLK